MNFLNEDRTVIKLPVPFGSEVYVSSTNCGDFCLFQRAKFQDKFIDQPVSEDGSHCTYHAPCHTTKPCVVTTSLTFRNLDFILREWGVRIFDNENDALKAAEKSVLENREKMKNLGFFVDSIGYGKVEDVN